MLAGQLADSVMCYSVDNAKYCLLHNHFQVGRKMKVQCEKPLLLDLYQFF